MKSQQGQRLERIHRMSPESRNDIDDTGEPEQIERRIAACGEVGGRVVGAHLAGVLA